MESFSLFVGAAAAFLGVILALLTLARRYVGWLKKSMREVLMETGLIKKGKTGELEPGSIWPNGSNNLPDFLDHMWDSQENMHREVETVHGLVNQRMDAALTYIRTLIDALKLSDTEVPDDPATKENE